MQSYNNYSKNPANFCEVSGYMLLKLNLSQVKLMSKFDLSIDDVRYIPMFEEYVQMRKEGLKVTHIVCHLAEKYFISESTVKRVVKRFSRKVKP